MWSDIVVFNDEVIYPFAKFLSILELMQVSKLVFEWGENTAPSQQRHEGILVGSCSA